ncbi:MAG: hypothetical protein ACK46Q_13215 [Hyphomonas sp.]
MEELQSLPEDVLVSYLGAGQVNNDLSTLHKLIVRARPRHTEEPVVWSSRFAMSAMLVAFAAGRLNEAAKTLNRHLNKVERDFGLISKMQEAEQIAWADVKRYFSQPNPITKVRDKVAFHTDTDHLLGALSLIPLNHEMIDFHFASRGDSLFGTADIVRLAGISQILSKQDLTSGFSELSEHSVQQSKNMMFVCWGYLRVVLQEYFPSKLKGVEWAELEIDLESIGEPLSFFYELNPQDS